MLLWVNLNQGMNKYMAGGFLKEDKIMQSTVDKNLDLVFARTPGELLDNVKNYLEKRNLKPVSMNVIKECNNFCAVLTSEPKHLEM